MMRGAVIGCALLALWQAAVWAVAPPPFILPGPAAVAAAWLHDPGLYLAHGAVTAAEIGLGLIFGVALGVSTALMIAGAPRAAPWLMPVLVISQAVPVFALAPVLVLWFGYGIASKAAMATLIIFFPVTSAFLDGLRRTEPGWLDLARTMNARPAAVLWRVRAPAALPALASGVRVAAAVAPIGAVVGEWVGAGGGLGYLMLHANGRMQTDVMFAALATLAVLALIIFFGLDGILRRATAWQAETAPPCACGATLKRNPNTMKMCISLLAGLMLVLSTALPARAENSLTVILDWFLNPDHATLVIAQEAGIFERAGLVVDMTEPGDPNDPPKLVAAGNADLAVSYQPQLHVHVAQDLPLTRVATLVATPLNALVVLDDGPVKTLADLKGRKIGYSVGGFEDALLGQMLESAELTLDDVELVNVNFSLSPSLISGQVDAVIGAFRNFELNQMDIAGHPGRAFYPEEHGVPAYDELIIVAHKDEADDDAVRAFVEALEEAVRFVVNRPLESWSMFIKAHPRLDDELNRRAWRDTVRRFALRPGALDERRYERFAEFLEDRGLIDDAQDAEDYAVDVRED
ncbi:MAG: ABC transporter substrate-binding protein [Rhodospirillales bacterium]